MLRLLPAMQKAREVEAKDGFIIAAYTAWQIVETIKAALGEKKGMSFADYLDMLKLQEKPKLTEEEAEELQKHALAAAEHIKNMYKGGE